MIRKKPLEYQLCTYVRPGLGGKTAGDLRIRADAAEGICADRWCLTVMTDLHNTDWPDKFDRAPDLGMAPHLGELLLSEFETYIRDKGKAPEVASAALLSAYKEGDKFAKESQTTASVLTACWLTDQLQIASVGVCRAYLLRQGGLQRLSIDDCAHINEGGVEYQLPNLLSNAIGCARIRTEEDIHLTQWKIREEDTIILCNKAFYQTVPEQSFTTTAEVRLEEFCLLLGEQASKESEVFDTLLLSVVRFR